MIIIDTDNTFGVDGCDIDDGLAILYALSQKVNVIGITTCFGNNKIEVVYPNTIEFMKKISRSDIPIYKGSEDRNQENKAAKFLVEAVNKYKNKISILCLGSLTNLYMASLMDPEFFSKVKEISLMGGITKPLIINSKKLNELNFSIDKQASYHVLKNAKNIIIATGNTCLDGLLYRKEFSEAAKKSEFLEMIFKHCVYWFDREKDVFGTDGIYLWDVHAAAALLNRDLFDYKELMINPDTESLKEGFLFGNSLQRRVLVPVIKDRDSYIDHIITSFLSYDSK